MLGVQNHKIKRISCKCKYLLIFVKLKPKYELEKTSKFKFNKGTIATHSTIANSQHRVILTFLTFLLSVVLTLLTLSHNMCHSSSNQLLIQAICEKTVLEVLNTHVVLLKQCTKIGVNWLTTIGNKAKTNIQITTSYSKFAC